MKQFIRQFRRRGRHICGSTSPVQSVRTIKFQLVPVVFTAAFVISSIDTSFQPTFAQSLDIRPSSFEPQSKSRPVSVLQNRFFLKSMRPEIGLMAGSVLNESYTSTFVQGLRTSVFIGEWVGIEAQWLTTSVKDSADRLALNKLKYRPIDGDATASDVVVSPDPDVNPMNNMRDFAAVAAPFYGKLNLFDALIVYSDLYITAGMSKVGTDQGPKDAFLIGGGQRLYMYDSFSVRLDFRNRIFKETRAGEKHQRNSWAVDIGASYLFF